MCFLILLTGPCADTISQKSQMCHDIFLACSCSSARSGRRWTNATSWGERRRPDWSKEPTGYEWASQEQDISSDGGVRWGNTQPYDRTRKHAWQTLTVVSRGNRKGNSLLLLDMVEKSQHGSGFVWGRFSHCLSFHSIYRWPGTDVSLLPQTHRPEKKRVCLYRPYPQCYTPSSLTALTEVKHSVCRFIPHRENGENRSLGVQWREVRGGNRFEHALSSTNQEVAGHLCTVIGQHVLDVRVRQFSTCFSVNTNCFWGFEYFSHACFCN